MRTLLISTLATASLLAVGSAARAQNVTGQMVLVQSSFTTLGGPVDVYAFQITNNTAFGIRSFEDLDFDGLFGALNPPTGTTSKQGSGLPEPFTGFFAPDSFVNAAAAAPSLFGTIVDSATDLDIETASLIAGGNPNWVNPAGTAVIATFAVAVGADAPLFNGGNAVVNGQRVAIVIPEPASLALLASGALLVLRRRKA